MQNIEILINLIEAVKNHPNLFKNSAPNCEQDEIKEWSAVAEECKLTISEAQNQWNQLLIEYVEYLRNHQDFNLAQNMDFLQPYFFTITDDENIDEDELLDAIDSKTISENKKNIIEPTKDQETVKSPLDLNENNKIESITIPETSSKTFTHCTQPKDAASVSSQVATQNDAFTNLSSLELIFLGYAKQLQKMPLSLQLKTKRKIADIMDEAELQLIS
ncbi:uncharacterized protein ACRADG_007200 [Cochliomyia hominivorax]